VLRGVISKIAAYDRWKVQSVIIGSLTYFRKYFRRSSSHAWKITHGSTFHNDIKWNKDQFLDNNIMVMDALFIAGPLVLIITWFKFIYRLAKETVMNLLKQFTVVITKIIWSSPWWDHDQSWVWKYRCWTDPYKKIHFNV